jgi:flagellar biosynthesis regulator FlbT
MADAGVSPTSYVKYAFTDQHNLVLLFGAACFSAAFASPWPLAVGAGAELLWLLIGPRLAPFRDWVDARLSTQYLARAETAIEGAIGELQKDEANRFVAVSRSAADLASAARQRKSIATRDVLSSLHGLLELRRTFLDYQFLRQRVVSLIDTTPTAEVEKEAARLQEEYAAERELTARMTIRKALTLAQKRLQQQQELIVINRTIETRLEMLEKVVPYLRGLLVDPAFSQLSQELDKAVAEIGPAESLEVAVDRTFDSPSASPLP